MSRVVRTLVPAAFALSLCALGCSGDDDDAGGAAGSVAASAGNTGSSGNGEGGDGAAGRGTGSGPGNAGASAGGTGGGAGGSSVSAAGSAAAGAGGNAGTGTSGGCTADGQRYADGETGIPAPDGCNTCSCNDGQLACTERACPTDECIVARRLDRCCAEYEAVLRSALATDECLTEEPGPAPSAARTQSCFEMSPDNCALVLCAPMTIPSRLSAAVGSGSAGGCSFVDECQSPDDCVIAIDSRQCCACPVSMPALLMERDACLVPEGSALPGGGACPPCTPSGLCGACAPPPEEPTCVIGDALNRCG